jgi:glycosyltransferase involved in cell wall biosynthesis
MKILYVITALVYGGAEKLLVNTANAMAKNHEITVCYLKDDARVANQFDQRIKIIKAPYGAKTVSYLRHLFKELQPDIVHTHCPHADILSHVASLGLRLNMITTLHNVWVKWNAADRAIFFIYRVMFNLCNTRVVAISDVVREHAIHRLRVKSSNVIRLHNAIPDVRVEYTKRDLRTRLGIDHTSFCVLFIGRLEQQKSVDTLIHATAIAKAQIQNLHVIILGHGRLKARLVNMAKSLLLDETITFAEPVPNPEYYYAAADVFALPSVYEGFGIVIIEAFRAGLAVVSTNIEGPKELIRNESNGLLFEPRDYIALSQAIIHLAKDAELRKRIGSCGRETYEGKFTIAEYVDHLTAFYRESKR